MAAEEEALTPGTPLRFFVVNVFIHRSGKEISSQNPQERRYYVSNLVAVPDSIPSYSLAKVADKYFEEQVVTPLKRQGLEASYYDSDLEINGGAVYALNTEADAKECRDKALESCHTRGGNIYEFTWSFEANASANPKLIFRDKEQPSYDGPAKPKPSKQH